MLLKMRWGLWNLEKLNVSGKCSQLFQTKLNHVKIMWKFTKNFFFCSDLIDSDDSPVLKRMYHLRYWLLNIIRGTYNFLAGFVFNELWMKFEEDLKHAKDMHSIIHGMLSCLPRVALWKKSGHQSCCLIFPLHSVSQSMRDFWKMLC